MAFVLYHTIKIAIQIDLGHVLFILTNGNNLICYFYVYDKLVYIFI